MHYSKLSEEQKIKRREANRRWRARNLRVRSDYQQQYDQNRSQSNKLLRAAKHRSAKYHIDFDINEGDLIVPDICPICDGPIKSTSVQGGWKHSPTVDRINPTLGYTKLNVAVICKLCNSTKGSGSAELHRRIAEYIDKH